MPSTYHAFHFPFISTSPQLYKVEITHLEQGLTHGTQQMLNTFLLNNKLTLNICVCVCVYIYMYIYQFSSVQSLSHARLFTTPWTAACQSSLSITSSWSLLKLTSISSVMPSNHLILCSLLLLTSVFPRVSFFSNESVLTIRWPKY